MMQTVQDYDRDDRGPGHAPKRTMSRFVTDAFSFLSEENCGDKDGIDELGGYRGVSGSRSEPSLGTKTAVRNESSVLHGVVKEDEEFTIVTSVEKSPVKKEGHDPFTQVNQVENTTGQHSSDVDKDQYTIVTYAESNTESQLSVNNSGSNLKDKTNSSQLNELQLRFNFNSVYIANDDDNNDTNNGMEIVDSKPDENNDSQKTDSERNSVIIEGDLVELRKSPCEQGERKSRQATWKTNQRAVSEAFGFLRELEDTDNPNPDEDTLDHDEETPVSVSGSVLNDNFGDKNKNVEDISGPVNANDDRQVSALMETGSAENDEVGELVGQKIRQRKKPKPKPATQSENAEDDGDSSDEDTGVYRESFRKSTWLYIGDNENLKVANPKDYVPLADLGVETCAEAHTTSLYLGLGQIDTVLSLFNSPLNNGSLLTTMLVTVVRKTGIQISVDSVFGDNPPKTPVSGHRRNDSTATTASEADFQKRYNSVSKRFVKRADSQQEYKRFTAQCYDQVKSYVIQKEPGQGYGIHLLDSKPAIVSGVDAGSPAESAGVKEGQIVTSVNGQNVLELDHDAIIRLVQQNATELKLDVGTGDVSHIIDLQRPVVTGYLQKQTSSTIFKVWKKRFFILRRDNCLYYYKTNQDQDPLGAIPLNGYSVSRHGDHNRYGFKAEKFGCRTFYFLAEGRDDMTRWVGALNEAAERGNEKKDAWMDVTTQNVGLPALEIRSPDCSGYLLKMGRATKRWRKRYCVLKDACIYYYKNSNSKQAEGVAHLHGYTVGEKGLPGKRNSFCLNPPEKPMRVFSFCTDNDTDRERWMMALNTSIGKWVRVEG